MVRIRKGSPRFRLWANDLPPILIGGSKAAAVAFLASVTAPLIGVTISHFGWFSAFAGAVGALSLALQKFLSDGEG